MNSKFILSNKIDQATEIKTPVDKIHDRYKFIQRNIDRSISDEMHKIQEILAALASNQEKIIHKKEKIFDEQQLYASFMMYNSY